MIFGWHVNIQGASVAGRAAPAASAFGFHTPARLLTRSGTVAAILLSFLILRKLLPSKLFLSASANDLFSDSMGTDIEFLLRALFAADTVSGIFSPRGHWCSSKIRTFGENVAIWIVTENGRNNIFPQKEVKPVKLSF